MRNRAKKLAYKLSEYGIFNVMGKMVPINSEEEVFKTLRMKYIEPWER
jgi:DNA polymerase/3'-5' exonuclease PolX